MNLSSIQGPDAAAAQTIGVDAVPTSSYPRLLRVFAGSSVAAGLCGLAALAANGDKGLHPAPFLALATLLAIAATGAFVSMLVCLVTETAVRWWKS